MEYVPSHCRRTGTFYIAVMATRPIKPGDELLVDYGESCAILLPSAFGACVHIDIFFTSLVAVMDRYWKDIKKLERFRDSHINGALSDDGRAAECSTAAAEVTAAAERPVAKRRSSKRTVDEVESSDDLEPSGTAANGHSRSKQVYGVQSAAKQLSLRPVSVLKSKMHHDGEELSPTRSCSASRSMTQVSARRNKA